MCSAQIFWFTGLSGSGKSTICEGVKHFLEKRGFIVCILDGDNIRSKRNVKLGFTKDDIIKNNHLIADMCEDQRYYNDIILVPVIAPYEDVRIQVKTRLSPNLFYIYVETSLQTVINRDTKGLYAKAKDGKIENLIGYSEKTPYELPQSANFIINTEQQDIKYSIDQVYSFIKKTRLKKA